MNAYEHSTANQRKTLLIRSLPAVAPAPKTAALPNFDPNFLAHSPCCATEFSHSSRNRREDGRKEEITHVWMLWVSGRIGVLAGLSNGAGVKFLGSCCVARIDICRGLTVFLLRRYADISKDQPARSPGARENRSAKKPCRK